MKRKQKRKHLESTYSPQTAKKSKSSFQIGAGVSTSQSARKEKSMERHRGAKLNLQEDALQPRHKAVAPTQGQKSEEDSSSSEYFPCVSSVDKLTGTGISHLNKYNPQSGYSLEDNNLLHEARDGSSESEYFPCYSTFSNFYDVSHAEILKKQKDTAQLGPISQKEDKNIPFSKYFSSISCGNKNTQVLDAVEDTPLPGPSGLAQGLNQTAEASDSEYITCVSSVGFWKTQEDASHPEPCVVVPSWSQTTGEKSSASEYFSCVSSIGKLIPPNEDGINQLHQNVSCLASPEMPLPQNMEQLETTFSFPLVNSNKPSVHMKEKRVTKIYYMPVQKKRDVAVLSDTEERLEPSRKKMRIEDLTFPEKIPTSVSLSCVFTKELLTESETSVTSKAQDKREEAGSPAAPPALNECSSAKMPEHPVALDSGFKCMGCCRVFPSLEILQKHVEHGVSEGFSCHAFHHALARLQSKKNRKGKKKSKKEKKIKKTTSAC